jgi:uncharacterized protein (DUF305 family)
MKRIVTTTLLAMALSTASLTAMAEAHTMDHGKSHAAGESKPCPCCATMMSQMAKDQKCPCCMHMSGMADDGDVCEHMMMNPRDDHAMNGTPSTREFQAANMTMHKGMDITYTGDADIDFLRGMIAHHQGAVDMARVQLKYGKNNQVRRLAQDIIRGQTLEIHWMETWLKQLEANKQHHVVEEKITKPGFKDATWRGDNWMGEY